MATTMMALNSPHIKFAEFVRLTLPSTTVTYCNAAAPITVNGITFQGMGNLLSISEINRNVKSTSTDLRVSLTGIDPNDIALVLSQDIKGSKLEIWRGFLDGNNQIITTPSQQFFKRYQGIVNTISIQEDYNEQAKTRVATCMIASTSMRQVLDSRVAGIKTNQKSWQYFYPNDTSMNRVAVIASTYFDFGKAPIGGSQATPVDSTSGNPDNSGGNDSAVGSDGWSGGG